MSSENQHQQEEEIDPDQQFNLPGVVAHGLQRGDACPVCGLGRLEFNGLLDLECANCGYSEGSGWGGCT